MDINEFKKLYIKNSTCCYFDKFKDFDFDNSLIDQNSHENIVTYDISCETVIEAKPFVLDSIKKKGLLEFMMGLDI